MEPQTQAKYEARAKIIKAMAHPTRLFIVDELSQHGQTVRLRIDRDDRRRHVHRVPPPGDPQERGNCQDEKTGQQVYYRLTMGVC